MTDLGTLGEGEGWANGINNLGQIVGGSEEGYALLWNNGNVIKLAFFGYSGNIALAINGSMQIVGSTTSPFWPHTPRALMWENDTVTYIGGHKANDINNYGQIVGYLARYRGDYFDNYRALLWENKIMIDLNDLIPNDSGWVLREAKSINDLGQIVGHGINPDGNVHAFLLTPIPEPESMIGLCVEANGPDGAGVVLDGTDFSEDANIVDDGMTYQWYEDFGETGEYFLGEGKQLSVLLDLGIHNISLLVTNDIGDTALDNLKIKVIDSKGPKVIVKALPLRLSRRGGIGIFRIKVVCLEDNYDPDPQIRSLKLNGYDIEDGAKVLLLRRNRTRKYNSRWFDLMLMAPQFKLSVEAIDSSGNIGRYEYTIDL